MRKIIIALALVALTSSSAFAGTHAKAGTSVDRTTARSSNIDRTHAVSFSRF